MNTGDTAGAILPPARLVGRSDEKVERDLPARRLRIAFVGYRAFHKGWSVFEQLAVQHHLDERYEFFQVGIASGPAMPSSIEQIPVRVTSEDRSAMVDALVQHEIDVCISWSLWPETFNFTVHEAMAAGTFVVARRDEGNVWKAAAELSPEGSLVVSDERGLFELFSSGRIIEIYQKSVRHRSLLVSNRGTLPLILAELNADGGFGK
ncbi:hypothetical protein [Devosia sp. SL43]|uniref:hypothetical protein n=1 Tax=Devosia sp. SL43 TaxID=2806348 RepID=UPI001F20A264|nr:hypothetical protein [Devosia sp. SL43]UJW85856.1 hypothetical protein IM737_00700 [Devosia sp. SL43]